MAVKLPLGNGVFDQTLNAEEVAGVCQAGGAECWHHPTGSCRLNNRPLTDNRRLSNRPPTDNRPMNNHSPENHLGFGLIPGLYAHWRTYIVHN